MVICKFPKYNEFLVEGHFKKQINRGFVKKKGFVYYLFIYQE
jgi:hypothetical protein